MSKKIVFILLVLWAALLIANPTFVPLTSIAEDCAASWCTNCPDAYSGLSILQDSLHAGEFVTLRYYTESGDLSNTSVDERISYYNVNGIPSVIFNGKTKIDGAGTDIADGSRYNAAMLNYRFADAPITLSITGFNATTGAISVRATMVSPDFALNNQSIRFLLVENDVSAEDTHVTRAVLTQTINLSGVGNYQDFTATFSILPTWNVAHLWAAAFVQMQDKAIVQSASTLAQPQYQIRAAFPFSPAIHDSANFNYTSPPIWLFNTGLADNYTIRLLQDDGPLDWYFNYCSEDGECYPGIVPNPFTLAPGEFAGYHLNLIIGNSGLANFHFLVESPNIEPYLIPFTYNTEVGNADYTSMQLPVILSQNSPNPFRENTNLRVFAKQSMPNTSIEIYNAKGQKVHEIQTGNLKQGMTEISWNGKTAAGQRLAQGVYFSRLKGNSASSTRKMLLID